jgi:hypothetical protein
MFMSRHQNTGQNHNAKAANKTFEIVTEVQYLGTTVTNQNLIHDEIKGRLNSGNVCYNSVHSLLSSRLLSKT